MNKSSSLPLHRFFRMTGFIFSPRKPLTDYLSPMANKRPNNPRRDQQNDGGEERGPKPRNKKMTGPKRGSDSQRKRTDDGPRHKRTSRNAPRRKGGEAYELGVGKRGSKRIRLDEVDGYGDEEEERRGRGQSEKASKRRRGDNQNQSADPNTMRLNRYLAHSGVAARRKADELIQKGLVTVNGEVVREMGYRVKPSDRVEFQGQRLDPEKKVYFLLNKPKNTICTTNDPKGRRTVIELVSEQDRQGNLYPVGRLDRNTTGLIILTNDGELAQKVSHPSYEISKLYAAMLDKPLAKQDMEQLVAGVKLNEGTARADEVAYINGKSKNEVGIAVHIGWNRVVRRMFETLGYKVIKLDRVLLGDLSKHKLPRGEYRELTDREVGLLKSARKTQR